MPFKLVWSEKSKKDFKLIEKNICDRILERVELLAGQDIPRVEKVSGQKFYKYRVGNYRIFIQLFPVQKIMLVLRVLHRKNAYKNL
ncbi:MAG: type II toxin-antitoxin system RelE/ParE family toxin [Candidatus Diapherotrites archaeon]